MTTPVYVHKHIVTFDETNLVGNVYFAHYLHWQGHCRELFLAEQVPDLVKALQDGSFTMVTVSCAMDYYAECFALDVVEIRMSLRASGGNRMTMNFDFRRGEELVAKGHQTVACLTPLEGRMVPTDVPAEIIVAIERYR